MKTSFAIVILLLTSTLGMFGQTPTAAPKIKGSDAQKYAAQLSNLLVQYQTQLSIKIAAEQQAYVSAAKLYDDAYRENVFASLSLDRTADSLAAEQALKSQEKTPDQFMDDIAAYTQRDFDQTKTLYSRGIDSYKTYLSNLKILEVDSDKVTALISILDDLATPASLKSRLTDIQNYQQSFIQQLHFSDCSMADSLLGIDTTKAASLDAQIAGLQSQIASAAAGVDTQSLQTQLSNLQQNRQDLQTEINTLMTKRANSGGLTQNADGTFSCVVK
jgi:hypothetical protein